MNPQVNWQKLKGELNKLTDVAKLREDLQKITTEIRNFDFHTILTPQAQERVKRFEKKYTEILSTVHQAQRQVDREVNKILRHVKGHHLLADVKLENIRKVANGQKAKLSKVTTEFRQRLKRNKPGTLKKKTTKKASKKAKTS